ncbi:hypothetical protein ACKWTF_007012 [Chironomus riparius]
MNESINLLVPFREFSLSIYNCRNKIEEALELLIFSTIFFIVFNIILFYLIHNYRNGKSKFRFCRSTKLPEHVSRVLLVTAHPDDECMFFGPTLIALKKKNCRIFVLCMSRGDYEKQGHVRKDELWSACKCFEIKAQDITLIQCTQLPDDPNAEWKVELISTLILNQVEALDIDLLITFDKDGISQHKNHQALYYATASLCLSGLIPSTCKILILETVNIVRKYLSLFDVLLSLLLSTNWCIVRWHERNIIQSAMQRHLSQMAWFRRLYIIFSRYMIINSLTELNVESIEFDILES